MSFEKIRLKRPRRSVFRQNNSVRTTLNIGEVIPSFWRIMVPGDTFHFGQVAQVELMPMVAPTKGDLYLESCAFFVAFDSLAIENEEKFTEILSHVTDTQQAVPIPKWDLETSKTEQDGTLKSTEINTLWDKFGFPLNLKQLDGSVTPIAYLQRAFNSIYNYYIRDENLDDERDLNDNTIPTCCYKKDLFTSAFLSPQKGIAPTLQLRGNASALWSDEVINTIVGILTTYNNMQSTTYQNGGSKVNNLSKGELQFMPDNSIPNAINGVPLATKGVSIEGTISSGVTSKAGIKVNQDLLDLLNNNTLDLSSVITFNIEELRTLNKLQKWLERLQIAGNRTKEFLLANYGVAPSNEAMDMPVFLGRLRTPVMINSVTSSVETQISGQTIPQGTKSGQGYGTNAVRFKSWTSKEPGLILVVSYLRPKSAYSQGINRQWIVDTVYDYYNPIFANLGNQEIKNAELFASGTKAEDTGIFGFTERNQELRYVPDVVTGDLRANRSLQSWSIGRHFTELPTLDSDFIHVNPSEYDYLFAISHNEQPQAVVTFYNICQAIRPLPKFPQATL